MKIEDANKAVIGELLKALDNNKKAFSCYHHGYAVILEELDELWEEVKKKPRDRNKDALREEAMQVAAMGIRFMVDLT